MVEDRWNIPPELASPGATKAYGLKASEVTLSEAVSVCRNKRLQLHLKCDAMGVWSAYFQLTTSISNRRTVLRVSESACECIEAAMRDVAAGDF